MIWSNRFQEILADLDRPYAPMFRLQIGTTAITYHMSETERISGHKVLEILSHPGTASYPDLSAPNPQLEGQGNFSNGYTSGPYKYVVGLTSRISMGAQSVSPRSFKYTGASLQVDVSRKAFSLATKIYVGAMAVLQVCLDDPDDPTTNEWNDIWYGQYSDAKWNGQAYQLSFVGCLQIVKQRHTQRIDTGRDAPETVSRLRDGYVTPEDEFKWFAGLGEEHTLSGTMDRPYTDMTLTAASSEKQFNAAAFGKTAKYAAPRAYSNLAFAEYNILESRALTPPQHSQWLSVTNSSGKPTWVFYQTVTSASRQLNHVDSNGSSIDRGTAGNRNRALPGRDMLSALDWDEVLGDGNGLDATSKAKAVCVLSGDPVAEVVNLIYVRGYHETMVPGLFAEGVNTLGPRNPLNLADIETQSEYFRKAFGVAVFGGDRVFTRETAPFRHVVTAPQNDGLSYVSKLLGKWGVFPRFKCGGWSVGVAGGNGWNRGWGRMPYVITPTDVEGAEWALQDPKTRGSFTGLQFVSNDPDRDGYQLADGSYPNASAAAFGNPFEEYTVPYYMLAGGYPPTGTLSNATSSVAMGSSDKRTDTGAQYNAWAYHYAKYFRDDLFKWWWSARRTTARVRLRGLKHAGLSPGDRLHVIWPNPIDYRGPGWGPYHETGVKITPILSTIDWDGTVLEADEAVPTFDSAFFESQRKAPWFVTSVQVDWVGCLVTVEMSRPEEKVDIAPTTWDGMTEKSDQHMAQVPDIQIRDD